MLSIIAAVGKNRELGKNNQLIWHIPGDMKFFKDTTMGHKVVMGRKTYMSLPGKLPGREIVVISTGTVDSDVKVESSINKIVDNYKNSDEEVFICGGASIYEQFLPYVDKIYLTEIAADDKDADTFFPEFDKTDWNRQVILCDRYVDIDYEICLYERKIM